LKIRVLLRNWKF